MLCARAVCVFSDDIRQKMMTKYVSSPEYNFEKVNRASQACGPMVKWAIAQVSQYTPSKRTVISVTKLKLQTYFVSDQRLMGSQSVCFSGQ